MRVGPVAEWLCRGLQSLVRRFDSGPDLHPAAITTGDRHTPPYIAKPRPARDLMLQSKFAEWIRTMARRWEPALRAAFAVALVIVAYLSLKPGIPGEIYDGLDKWRHIAAYATLGVSGTLAFATRRHFWFLLAGLTLYGATLELAQTFVDYRTGSWLDFSANVAGVVIGMIVMRGVAEVFGIGTTKPRRGAS
jgi:VanZ family protein